MSFSTLSSILNKSIQQKPGLTGQILATLVCEEFDKIILEKWGDKMKDRVKALYLKNNIITVASLSAVLAQEIKFQEKEILLKINQKFGCRIERVRYIS